MIRTAILVIAMFVSILNFLQNKPDMVAPTLKHHEETSTKKYDRVEITCPEGYEGHFVDIETGFTSMDYGLMGQGFMIGRSPGYTVCFSKQFMEKIRANPELLRMRPEPPHGV